MANTLRSSLLVAAIAGTLAGCSSSSAPLPPQSPLSAQSLAGGKPLIYSTHVTFRGPDGRSYSGDAVILPRSLFPQLRASQLPAALRGELGPRTGSLAYYMAIPGMTGAVTLDRNFVGWTQLESFSIALDANGGAKLTITKSSDVVSPPILGAVFSGQAVYGRLPRGTHDEDQNSPEIDVVGSNADHQQAVTMYFQFRKKGSFQHDATFTGFLNQYASLATPGSLGVPVETDEMSSTEYRVCVYPIVNGNPGNVPVCSDD